MALTPGQVADEAGVTRDTVLYYEREGILEEPPRTNSGYRQFPHTVVPTIRFVQEAQTLGFTLDEIQSLMSIRDGDTADCDEVRTLARDKQKSIRQKIQKLQRIEQTLGELIERCERDGSYDYCPIIESLQPEEEAS